MRIGYSRQIRRNGEVIYIWELGPRVIGPIKVGPAHTKHLLELSSLLSSRRRRWRERESRKRRTLRPLSFASSTSTSKNRSKSESKQVCVAIPSIFGLNPWEFDGLLFFSLIRESEEGFLEKCSGCGWASRWCCQWRCWRLVRQWEAYWVWDPGVGDHHLAL